MRRDVLAVFSFVAFTMLAGGYLAAQDNGNLPTLSVALFSGNKAQIPDWQPALGQCVSEMLIETLESPGGKFKVLQLTKAAGPQTEFNPGKPDSANGDMKPITGGSPGSDFTFYGDVTQLTVQTNSSQVGDFLASNPLANVGVKVVTAHVQIEWCIMDTGTKKVIKRGTAANFATGSALNMAAVTAGNGKAAAAQSAVAQNRIAQTAVPQNSAAHVKTPATPVSGAVSKPTANDIFSGLGKALGNAPANAPNVESGGENAKGNGVAKPVGSPKAVGEIAANSGETLGYENPEFMNSAFGKATSKAIANIVGQLAATTLPESSRSANLKAITDALKHAPGKVLAVAGKDTIIVSFGGKEGFKEGDKLEMFQTNDVKDDKGNVVYSEEKPVGELTIVSVQDDKSRASYSGDLTVQQGWTVKAK